MPGRRTRKRRAGKKLANNVASVLRRRIENMKERESNNAVAAFMLENPEQFYNANENYNGNAQIIATTIPFVSLPPVRRSKSRGRSKKSRRFRKTLARAHAANRLNDPKTFRPTKY